MKYKKIVTALLAVFSLAMIFFATGCGESPDVPLDVEASYEFEGLKDVKLTLDAESYYFVQPRIFPYYTFGIG